MTYTIKYSTSSKIDIKTSVNYINTILQNPFAGNRLRIEIQATVRNLKIFPFKYPLVTDLFITAHKIRFVQVKNYLLFYTVTEETKTIYIVRFLYSRRDWQHILQRTVKYDEYFSKNTTYYVHENQEEFGKQFKKEPSIMTETINNSTPNDNFDEETARQELYNELKKGLDDIAAGRTVPADEVFAMFRKNFEGYDFK